MWVDYITSSYGTLMEQCIRFLRYKFWIGPYPISILELGLCMMAFMVFMDNIGRMFGKSDLV